MTNMTKKEMNKTLQYTDVMGKGRKNSIEYIRSYIQARGNLRIKSFSVLSVNYWKAIKRERESRRERERES